MEETPHAGLYDVQDVGAETPRWVTVFEQIKEATARELRREKDLAMDFTGQPSNLPLRLALEFLASVVETVSPTMAATVRPSGAEKSIIFSCFQWTDDDRRWLDTFATFDHRTSDDQKIVWIPGRDNQERLREMYQSLQSFGCSPALRQVLREHGPRVNEDDPGRYVWFWTETR